jgi:GntR family transcriptional regulator
MQTQCHLERPAHRLVAEQLRQRAERGEYGVGGKLPTEDQLRRSFGVGRHTVRRAVGHLVEDGTVQRIQGSGTYLIGHETNPGSYQRAIGTLEEIMRWPGTTTKLLEPFRPSGDPSVADELGIDNGQLQCALVQRCHDRAPFALTRHYMSSALARRLTQHGMWAATDGTIIESADKLLPDAVASATQTISATRAQQPDSHLIGCAPGDAVLLIERLYHDARGRPVEFTASRLDPRRYTYRMDLHRQR